MNFFFKIRNSFETVNSSVFVEKNETKRYREPHHH